MIEVETYNFQLRLNRAPTDEEADALFEAGLDDAGIETSGSIGILDVDREAPTLMAAVTSAVRQVESVGDLRVVGLGDVTVVTLREAAERLGRSYEAVRLWADGKRGPGGFPSALVHVAGVDSARAYSWPEVADWAAVKMRVSVIRPDPLLTAVGHALALRAELDAVKEDSAEAIRDLIKI